MENGYQGSFGGARNIKKFNYTVDMVFCIDATRSMEASAGNKQRIINMVKQHAIHFYEDLTTKMREKNKKMAQLRVRIIAFRDYMADGESAMQATDFYLLPEQSNEFEEIVNDIIADGGGDLPEDGLEALAYAMKSKWTDKGDKKRQVIVVWTDAGTHELGFGKESEFYPNDLPKNLAELEDIWDEMDPYAKRLILYSPYSNYWNYVSDNWDNVYHFHSVAGDGLSEHEYEDILNVIANTI